MIINFNWISVIRLPDFITKKDFDWAVKRATIKKKIDCSKAEFFTFEEGLCVQMMHQGSFDDEINTVEIMNQFLQKRVTVMILTNQGYIMKFIYQMQEKMLRKNGKQ